MNPHYNQQQQQQPPYQNYNYNYNYQQHVPGPPQPPWPGAQPQPQVPGGWNDPRFQNQNNPQGPQQNAPVAYNTSGYGPQPPRPQGAPQYDTSGWGVKYNQTAQNASTQHSLQLEQKPALPPRPNSALAQPAPQRPPNYDQPTSPVQHLPQGSWNIVSPTAQGSFQPAPPPPPRPAAYTQYAQAGVPAEQYSHHPPTHQYDPHPHPPTQTQPSWQSPPPPPPPPSAQDQPSSNYAPSAPSWNHGQHMNEGPVSPMDDDRRRYSIPSQPAVHPSNAQSSTSQSPRRPSAAATTTSGVQTSATALAGHGRNPSDWQHYYTSDSQENQGRDNNSPVTAGAFGQGYMTSPKPVNVQAAPSQIQSQNTSGAQTPSYTSQTQTQSQQQSYGYSNKNRTQASPPPLAQHSSSPAQRKRSESRQSTVSSMSGTLRNDTIDNVIQAWSAPITTDSGTQTILEDDQISIEAKPGLRNGQTQTDFPPQTETTVETRVEIKEVPIDPYADIQNEYKATLNRFVGMLRQEAAAQGDEEKFRIFQGFVIHELRLRSVLYGVEATPNEHISSRSEESHPQNVSKPKLTLREPSKPDSREKPLGSVDTNDLDEYSPGGRPRMVSQGLQTSQPSGTASKPSAPNRAVTPGPSSTDSGNVSPSMNAPMTLDDYATPNQHSPSSDAPMVVGDDEGPLGPAKHPISSSASAALAGPINFQPSRPVYQPFRYGEGTQPQIPAVVVHGPQDSYTSTRQNQAAESGRTLIPDAPPENVDSTPDRSQSKTPSGRREHEEAFIGLIRAKSLAMKKPAVSRPESPAILRAGTPTPKASPTPPPVLPIVKAVNSLRSITPKTAMTVPDAKSPPLPKLAPIQASLAKLPDDFSFIHARVVSWDKSNRQERAKQESERQARQSENEVHNDQLFNDNEIGYADIARLEKEFQLEEADKKYKEDQHELDSFTRDVFQYVVEKLEDDLTELTKLQTNVVDMLDLDSSSAAKQVQNSVQQGTSSESTSGLPVSVVMPVLLETHAKIEVRHIKIAEARFERERRRKRLELSVLFTNRDKSSIKKLEAEFAKAEKLQILEENRRKSERANRLLDSFDRATVRGLAENQGLIDDVLTKTQLVRDLLLGSEDNLPPPGSAREDFLYNPDTGVRDLMSHVTSTVDFLLHDSKTLVRLLNRADVISNEADFSLFTSEASLADATAEKFDRLKTEKAAEDRNVGEELNSRLNGIAQVPNEVFNTVREVRDKIGSDAGHGDRIGKALEAAKLRNNNTSVGN